jgi:acarbose 7IV-phosphotransferase
MARVLVSGLINFETTLKITGFPLEYNPVNYPFFGVDSTVSGVGYNVAKALVTLGNDVRLASLIGQDETASLVLATLERDGIHREFVVQSIQQTAQSVILYDPNGTRQIHTDLKDVQEQLYPEKRFDAALENCDLVVACNVNFSRGLLRKAKHLGIAIATDLHTLVNLENPYDQDFLHHADIVFFSHERLQETPEQTASQIFQGFATKLIVAGLGANGAMLFTREAQPQHMPAIKTREIVNTIGAGDALFSSFNHFYAKTQNALESLKKAVLFASYKIGETGAANGFLTEPELQALTKQDPTRV